MIFTNKDRLDFLQISLSLIFTRFLNIFSGHLVGVGVGTILAMIGVGRTIAIFNHFTYTKMKELAAVED